MKWYIRRQIVVRKTDPKYFSERDTMSIRDKTAIVGIGATPYYKRGKSEPQTKFCGILRIGFKKYP